MKQIEVNGDRVLVSSRDDNVGRAGPFRLARIRPAPHRIHGLNYMARPAQLLAHKPAGWRAHVETI